MAWWTALLSEGIGNELDLFNNKYGGDFWDYTKGKTFGEYAPWESEFYTKEGIVSTQRNALKNLVDPGGFAKSIFGWDLFGEEDSGGESKIAGLTQKEWAEKLGMSDEEYQNYLTELTRSIATSSSESRNRFSEIAAMNRLPEATRLAAERGIQIQANRAIQEGSERLTRMQEDINRQAEMTALQLFASKEARDEDYARQLEAQSEASFNSMLNMLGQYVGEKYFGNNNSVNIADYNQRVVDYGNQTGDYSRYVFGQDF